MDNMAVGYVRCSTDMQDQSIEDQKKAISQFAKKNDLEIQRWYEDEDASGTSIARRRGFQTLKNLVEQNRHDFSKVLIYDVTRWGRFPDPRESTYWEIHFQKKGVDIVYINENFRNDRPFEMAIIRTVEHAAAGDFSRKLSQLTTRGSRTTAEKGFWNGAPAPYGYKRAETDSNRSSVRILENGEKCRPDYKVMLVKGDPEQVKVVQRIFDSYVNRGMGVKAIASMFNSERIPSPHRGCVKCFKRPDGSWERRENKGEWGISTVWRILTNPMYAGVLVWGKLKSGVFSQAENTWGDVNGSKTLHDQDKWVVCEKAHEPLISKDIFDKAQTLRKNKNYFRPSGDGRTYGSSYLLTGLLVCSNCGHKFHGHTHQADKVNGQYQRTYRYYEDGGFYYKGKSVCESLHIRKEKVDDFVLQKIAKRLNNPSLFPVFEERLRKELDDLQHDCGEEHQDTGQMIKDIDKRMDNLLDLVEKGRISQEVRERLKKLQEERERLNSISRKAKRQIAVEPNIDEIVAQFRSFIQGGAKALDSGTNEEKKLLIRKFVKDAIVDRGKNQVRFSFYRLPTLSEDCASYPHRSSSSEIQGAFQ